MNTIIISPPLNWLPVWLKRSLACILIIAFSINDYSYALDDHNLAPRIGMTLLDFKDRFKEAYDLLGEAGAIEHIEREVDKAGGIINMDPRADSVNGDIDIMVVPIPGLLDSEGRIAYFGAAASAGTPIIYIDSKYFYDEDSLRNAKKIIADRDDREVRQPSTADDGSRSPSFGHTEPLAPRIAGLKAAIERKEYAVALAAIIEALDAEYKEGEDDPSAVNFDPFKRNVGDLVALCYPTRAGPGYEQLNEILGADDVFQLHELLRGNWSRIKPELLAAHEQLLNNGHVRDTQAASSKVASDGPNQPSMPSTLPIPNKRFEYKFMIRSQDIVKKAIRYAESNGMQLDKNTEKDGGYTVYSLYLESAKLKTFYDRENGVPDRFKARIRYYGDGRLAILELKNRVKGVGMWKNRAFIKMEHVKDVLAGRFDYNWLLKPDDPKQRLDLDAFAECMHRYDLKPHVYVAYERLAYVSTGAVKMTSDLRITFDSNVRVAPFRSDMDLRALPTDFPDTFLVWPDTTIMEVKFTPPYYPRWVQDLVEIFSLEKTGAGKYCDGVKIADALVPGDIQLTGLPLTKLADRALSNTGVREYRRFADYKAMRFTAALAVFEELMRSKNNGSPLPKPSNGAADDESRSPSPGRPVTAAAAIGGTEVSGADPAEILRAVRDNDGLLREAAIGKGIIIHNAAAANVLLSLGIIVPADEKGVYRFSSIMIGADLNYTQTMINVVNDLRYDFDGNGEEGILAKRDMPQDVRPFARELIKAALLHRINSALEPAIPEGKIVWHIIESDLIPIEQKASLVTQANKVFRESGLRERIRILREGETVEEAIKAIKDEHGGDGALFDVALSDVSHIDSVPMVEGGERVRMLVYNNPGAAFVQLEGVVAALRALYAPNDEALSLLLKIYSAVCEMPFPQDAVPPPELLDDPRGFARIFVFKLPPIKRIPGDDIKDANDRLIRFLVAA